MIAFKYTKYDGAEYLSHLDLLRHIDRTLRRANIPIAKSEGFNKHPRIFLNNPLGLGVKSIAEYGTIDTPYLGDFASEFNKFSPQGVKCLAFKQVDKNQNYANEIVKCRYEVKGITHFDLKLLLDEEHIEIVDLRGRTVDIRPRIYLIEWQGDTLSFVLGCGENNLRPDLFCSFLQNKFGGAAEELIKTASYGDGIFL
jgi:radical SAM-linked protein